MATAPNAERFPPLPPGETRAGQRFGKWERPYFPSFMGIELEEVREGYARMRLPYRTEFDQPTGVVHGGVIATLIDTVVVPAIGSTYQQTPEMLTIDMQVQYLGAVAKQDAIAEGWVEKRGRSLCFCRAEVRTDEGELAATGTLVYRVRATD